MAGGKTVSENYALHSYLTTDSYNDIMVTDTCIFYRAMAGGKSVSENYAFAGMHHIFDQHTAAGKFITVQRLEVL
jgi:hypothetical protein